ncbi:T9SS type A sorting domain-containing protein [Lacinutrix sp. WUR7]|uniref:endonuclease n=1 Tax=Lacinutrix sp. WUR7 TaxID=2653681 RepID=UPI00193CD56D|nr:endonuclease [Lacinutrix sp. WUR7]QRM89894.1 T9SS type A sorting domain-containing protein [Lacinutrix sp. WUR7]
MKQFYSLLLLLVTITVSAQIPSGYYDDATGTGYTLKTQLKIIITNGHVDHGYTNDLYVAYQTSDTDSYYENDNSVLDMYSENPVATDPYNFAHDTNGGSAPGQACGSYSIESDCYNREHLFPQGFFDSKNPMRGDIHHVIPTDGRVNGFRNNYPFGNVGTNLVSQSNISNPTRNGSKLGNSISPGYSGTVFEPIDEFKGDIARMLLYFAVRYEDNWNDSGWSSHTVANNPLNGTSNQFYETWYVNLLYSWHLQDGVSQREIDRNNAAYAYQGNANPFINHPEYVQAIWSSILSVDDFETVDAIKMYPNPSNGNTITIVAKENLSVEVYDVLGKRIKMQNITPSQNKLNISGLSKGLYLVRFNSATGSTTKKLIKS